MASSLKIYQFYLDGDQNTLDYYKEYLSKESNILGAIGYCICSDIRAADTSVIGEYIEDIHVCGDKYDSESREYIYFAESLIRKKSLYVVHDPLEESESNGKDQPIFNRLLECIQNLTTGHILSSEYREDLDHFSQCIEDIENPLWRGNFRSIYRYLSSLSDSLMPLSIGTLQSIDVLSELNVLKAAKYLSVLEFPEDGLLNASGSTSLHTPHKQLHKAIRTISGRFSRSLDSDEFPLLYLWFYLILEHRINEFIGKSKYNDALVYLTRIIEIAAQALLLKKKRIHHKGYGRFCSVLGDNKNLLGAGSYLSVLTENGDIDEVEYQLLAKIVKARNQLLSAHGLAAATESDFEAIFERALRSTDSMIRKSVRKVEFEGFKDMIGSTNSDDTICYFLQQSINHATA